MSRRRWWGAAVAALGVAAGASACSGGPQVDPDGTVRVAINQPAHLLPADTHEPAALQVLSTLFTPLVEFDAEGRPAPAAATRIDADATSQTWTIHLRDDLTFHDGTPVTADSYLDAWNAAAHAANGQRGSYLFARIEGYDAVHPPAGRDPAADRLAGLARVDDHTFTVTLTEPFRDFPAMLGYPAFYPLPPAAFTADGAPDPELARAPVGNGPFRFAGWEDGRITVQRFDAYAGTRPRAGAVEFAFYDDPVAVYEDLLTGAVDVVGDLPAPFLPAAPDDLGERYLRHPAPSFQFLAFPAHQGELADPDLRRAISMAIDRDRLFGPARTPAHSFTGPAVPGFRPDSCGESCKLDPAAARELYRQADGPQQLRLTYNRDGGHERWMAALCEQLQDHLDVACETRAEPTLADVLAGVDAGADVGLFRLGWVTDYPTLEGYLRPLYAADGSLNWHGYRNAEFDALLAAGRRAGSHEDAIVAYQAAEDLLARDLPVIPLSSGAHHIGHSERVRGVTAALFGVDLSRVEVLVG